MSYNAKEVYKNKELVSKYDRERFSSLKGRIVDWREKYLIFKAIKLSGIKPPARILDLPCGTGRLSIFLAEKGFNVVGIDISNEMIKQSKLKIIDSNLINKVKFIVGDGENIQFPDSFFDIGISLRLFGHLPIENRISVLKELSRVSKRFVIVVYYHKNSLQELIKRKNRIKKGVYWYPIKLKKIDEELKTAGLKRVSRHFLFPFFSETVVILSEKISSH